MTALLYQIYDQVVYLKELISNYELSIGQDNDFTNFLDTTIVAWHHGFYPQVVDTKILNRIQTPEFLKSQVIKVWSKQGWGHIPADVSRAFYLDKESHFMELLDVMGPEKYFSLLTQPCIFSLTKSNGNVIQRTGLSCHYSPRRNDKISLKSVGGLSQKDDNENEAEMEEEATETWGKTWGEIVSSNGHLFKGKIPRQSNKKSESSAQLAHICNNKKFMYCISKTPNKFVRTYKNQTMESLLDRIFSLFQQNFLKQNSCFMHLLGRILTNHTNTFSLSRKPSLINRCCPLPKGFFRSGSFRDISCLVKASLSQKQVCNFIRLVLIQVFPSGLFGNMDEDSKQGLKNRRLFYKGLKIWLTSGFTVRLELKNLIRGISLSSISWLNDFKTRIEKKQAFESFVRFIIIYFNDLISVMFYATETQFGRSQIFFYRQEVWERISQFHQFHGLQPVSGHENGKVFSRCRLIPKKSSVRMICPDAKAFVSVTQKKCLVSLLRTIRTRPDYTISTPKKFKIFTRIDNFIASIREDGEGELFAVKVDIRDCYPSIKHDVLSGIVQNKLRNWMKSLDMTCVFVRQVHLPFVRKRKLIYRSYFLPIPSQNRDLMNDASFLEAIELQNRVVVPSSLEVIKDPVGSILPHFKHLVKVNAEKLFLMTQGLRQGGSLSSDLCSLYMDEFIHHFLNGMTIRANDVVVHVVYEADDILFASKNKESVELLMTRFIRETNLYNLQVNPDKIFSNFLPSSPSLSFVNVTPKVPFCGLLFDSGTRSILSNFDTFIGGGIKYSFNCNPFLSFDHLADNLIGQVGHMKPILLDERFNHPLIIVQNILERVLLLATKFASFIIASPSLRKDSNGYIMCLFAKKLTQKLVLQRRSWIRADLLFKSSLSSHEIAFICCRGIL